MAEELEVWVKVLNDYEDDTDIYGPATSLLYDGSSDIIYLRREIKKYWLENLKYISPTRMKLYIKDPNTKLLKRITIYEKIPNDTTKENPLYCFIPEPLTNTSCIIM